MKTLIYAYIVVVVAYRRWSPRDPYFSLSQGRDFFFFTRSLIQALEPETLIPLSLKGAATQVVLAGDWQQLGPVVHSRSADQLGLGEAPCCSSVAALLQLCCSSVAAVAALLQLLQLCCSAVAVLMLLYTAVYVSWRALAQC